MLDGEDFAEIVVASLAGLVITSPVWLPLVILLVTME